MLKPVLAKYKSARLKKEKEQPSNTITPVASWSSDMSAMCTEHDDEHDDEIVELFRATSISVIHVTRRIASFEVRPHSV